MRLGIHVGWTLLLLVPSSAAAAPGEPFFAAPCGFSHRAPDDPIVVPDRPGAAHLHDFFGNRSTSAASTYETLRAAGSTCRRGADRAAYWAPTLFAPDGTAVAPRRAAIYYRGGRHRDVSAVQAFPPGLRVIAGNARAAGPQPAGVTSWHCGPDGSLRGRQAPPLCPQGRDLRLQVRFQDCWDGARLDSPDHASHMAYARAGRCPPSHPVAVPQIVMNVRYPLRDGRGATLSSGPAHTAHADFFNAWEQGELERLVRVCIRGRLGNDRVCRPGVLPPPPLAASAGTVAHRGRVTLTGQVGGAAGRPVRIQYRRRHTWEALAVVTTGDGGAFTFPFRAGSSHAYRALGPDGRATRVVRVGVRPRVSAVVRRRGRLLTVRARVTPMKRRLVFRAERLLRGRWQLVARREADTRRGSALAALRVSHAGTYRVRALSRGDARHQAGRSRAHTIRVR